MLFPPVNSDPCECDEYGICKYCLRDPEKRIKKLGTRISVPTAHIQCAHIKNVNGECNICKR